ncbi:MAG: hypothetical protein FWB97_07675 [Oscillospiraceae bacterium]|nr:hypothetical protein [Oscillospiraceae bacterium]
MKLKSKRVAILLLTLAMLLTLAPLTVFAGPGFIGIQPRVAVGIDMFTDADGYAEVEANEVISVTVGFRSILAPNGEPITIRATNGAEILVTDIGDVQFKANGVPAPIRDLAVGDGRDWYRK